MADINAGHAEVLVHVAASDPHGDRAYALALFAANDALVYKGVIDCSANPNYPAADAGYTYRVSAAGKIGGASGVNVEVGDIAICVVDGTLAGTQAGVGANWDIVQTNLDGAVIGPASVTDGNIVVFDGTTGKLVKQVAAISESQVTNLVSDLAAKAPLASPTFTGTPAAPTAAPGTNTTQLATTAFVETEVAAEASTRATADTTLQTNITAEASPRATADTTLQTNITTEATRAQAAEALLGSYRRNFLFMGA